MGPDDNCLQDGFDPTEASKSVCNHNKGSGVFNHVNGTQILQIYSPAVASSLGLGGLVEGSGGPTDNVFNGRAELEPYRTTISTLCHIRQQARWLSGRFPFDNSLVKMCSKADGLASLTRCMARATDYIQQTIPSMLKFYPFTSFTDQCVFEWMKSLKGLARELDTYMLQDHPRAVGMIAFHWPSLCQRLQNCFHICRAEMIHQLSIVA